ncbi:MAG: hypothetical protein Q8O82_05930 [Pseudorhodobacter sp.]|nr:hypothetical protein [Pseudorhodobacter sp.]
MNIDHWLLIISRITSFKPIELDEMFDVSLPNQSGGCDAERTASEDRAILPPSSRLWLHKNNSSSYIGVRVNDVQRHLAQVAFRLAAAALERCVVPIIFSTIPSSGFERFGFRVELLVGESHEDILEREEELKRYWNISVIINASDITALA